MNHLSGVRRLANRFYGMRHGQSRANAAGIIVSFIDNDRRGDFGLSPLGCEQALTAARRCRLPSDTVIVSSDFARARQTAEIVRGHLGARAVVIAQALRERRFGVWEGVSTSSYAQVWEADAANPDTAAGHVEPAAAVLDRTTALIIDLERRYSGQDILLVAHGDPLQILQAGFRRIAPSRHRSLPPLETAEIRPLHLAEPDSTLRPDLSDRGGRGVVLAGNAGGRAGARVGARAEHRGGHE